MILGLSSVSSETESADGYVNANSVRMREGPSMISGILTELSYGTAVRILGQSGDWTQVICNGRDGFIYSSYVTVGSFQPVSDDSGSKSSAQAGSTEPSAQGILGLSGGLSGEALGRGIASYALGYVGYRYTWGGTSPATGFDCSGFVQYIFSQFGYSTSRVANDVLSDGVAVDPADIRPGDVLCFYSGNNYVGHVGIYVGSNTFVHAANSATGVVTTSLSEGYYASRGYAIRRII